MKVSELIVRLSELKQDADVMFDTEAQTYDVHLAPVDAAWPIDPEESLGRDVVYLSEEAPHRCDDRDARIAEKDAEIARLTNALELADASAAAKDAELDSLRHEMAHPFDAEEVRAKAARIAALESESAQYREAAEKAEKEGEWLRNSRDFYSRRCNLLQSNQHRMRDPERTLLCDVLANGQLLPDPDGKRYGSAALAAVEG